MNSSSSRYYKQVNKNVRDRLRKEKAEERERIRQVKAESVRKRKEQHEALARMKREGIKKEHEKAFIKTRERRLKKLGMKVEKEKTDGGLLFHVDKTKYKRKKKGGLFAKKQPLLTMSWGKKKRGRKKKSGFWSMMRSI